MKAFYSQRMRALTVTAAALSCLAGATAPISQAAAPIVTYTASGTFSTPATSGADLFKLAGQPFSISIVASEATVPTTHGGKWAKYTKLKMTGTVQSALLPTPTTLSSSSTSLQLATGNPSYNVLALFAPVYVIKMQINIQATINMPVGTMTKPLIYPFTAPVTLAPTNATVTYSDPKTGNSTALTVATGTLTAIVTGAPTTGNAELTTASTRTIPVHGDSMQPLPSLLAAAGAGDMADLGDAFDLYKPIAGEGIPARFSAAFNPFSKQAPSSLSTTG